MANRFWVGGTATWDNISLLKWSTTSGGLGGAAVPNNGDNVFFDANSGSGTVTISSSIAATARNLDCTGFTGTITGVSSGFLQLTGGFILAAGMGFTFQGDLNFISTLANSINTNGISLLCASVTFNGTGSWTLLGNFSTNIFSANTTLQLIEGTLDLNNFACTMGQFLASGNNTRTLGFGTTGQLRLIDVNTVFDIDYDNLTVTGNSVIVIVPIATTGVLNIAMINGSEADALNFYISPNTTFDGLFNDSGAVYNNLAFNPGFTGTLAANDRTVYGPLSLINGMTTETGVNATIIGGTNVTQKIYTDSVVVNFPLTVSASNSIALFTSDLNLTSDLTFTDGTIQFTGGTINTVGNFFTTGTNPKILNSDPAGAQATISKASGVVDVSYLTIQDSFADGGATFNAFLTNNNFDAGNNTNWNFTAPPSSGGAFNDYIIRSFLRYDRVTLYRRD